MLVHHAKDTEWVDIEADTNKATLVVPLKERCEVDQEVRLLVPHRARVGERAQIWREDIFKVVRPVKVLAELFEAAYLVGVEADREPLRQVVVTMNASDPPLGSQLTAEALVFALLPVLSCKLR